MEFFPHITERETFKSTFLNEVALKIFLPSGQDFVTKEKVARLFNSMFGLSFLEDHYNEMKETRIKVGNASQGVVFEFSKTAVKISIDQEHYSNFETSVVPLLEKFVKAYEDWYDCCDNLEVKMVDVWPVADNKKLTDVEIINLEKAIFTPELRKSVTPLDNNNFKSMTKSDSDCLVYLKYGYYDPESADSTSGLALETKCESLKKRIKTGDIVSKACELNSLLYDVFIWSVTPTILEAMRTTH